eukprot:6206957-Pleurochrysis_carterae.AAC.4
MRSPRCWHANGSSVVVPPQSAATDALKKLSDGVRPADVRCSMWQWLSTPARWTPWRENAPHDAGACQRRRTS